MHNHKKKDTQKEDAFQQGIDMSIYQANDNNIIDVDLLVL